jgi:excisionase family DNA binding protein
MRSGHNLLAETHWTSSVTMLQLDSTQWRSDMSGENKPPASDYSLPILGRPGIEPLLDSHKAAALLGVHPRTLQRMVHRGEIVGVHVGKLWRFKPSAIAQWIEREMAS